MWLTKRWRKIKRWIKSAPGTGLLAAPLLFIALFKIWAKSGKKWQRSLIIHTHTQKKIFAFSNMYRWRFDWQVYCKDMVHFWIIGHKSSWVNYTVYKLFFTNKSTCCWYCMLFAVSGAALPFIGIWVREMFSDRNLTSLLWHTLILSFYFLNHLSIFWQQLILLFK